MIDFYDIDSETLKSLGLNTIKGFDDLKLACHLGYREIYQGELINYFGKRRLAYRPTRVSEKVLTGGLVDGCTLVKRFEIENFCSLTVEMLVEAFGFSGKSLCKLIWLQKYLNGEVDPPYKMEEDEEYINELIRQISTEKIIKIRKLESKISELNGKNAALKLTIKKLEEQQKEVYAEKKKIEKFKKELSDFLN